MATPKKSAKKPPPKKKAAPKRSYEPMSPLHILLTKAFPEHRTASYDVLDIKWLAGKMECTDEGVYTWLRDNCLPMKRARALVAIRGCRIKLDEILPFVK